MAKSGGTLLLEGYTINQKMRTHFCTLGSME